MKAAPTAAFQNLSTLCIQSFLRNLNHRRKPKRRSRSCTIDGACHVRKIDYPGSNNYTSLMYGPLGFCVKIVEIRNASITSTKQFVGDEERDSGGSVTRQFFRRGEIISGTAYFYVKDHLGSIREVSDSTGAIHLLPLPNSFT